MAWIKQNWFFIIIVIVIGTSLLWERKPADKHGPAKGSISPVEVPVEIAEGADNSSIKEGKEGQMKIVVDIKGEVQHPGVYEVEGDERLQDIVDLAGGFTVEADQTTVNLAQRVYDEMVVTVAAEGEVLQGSPSIQSTSKVRVNAANKEELMKLSGIGEAKAEAVIAYREENGPFQQPDDLLNVSGVGEKVLELLREEIQIP